MVFQIIIKPISNWIGAETKTPGNSQFRNTYSDTKKILEFELGKLNAVASSVQLEMFIKPEELLLNGTALRAHVKPYKPGVVLSFSIITRRLKNNQTGEITNETKTLSYPCDTFNDWQDNVRAIALSLEKLRSVARYGVFKYEDMISRLALPSAEGKLSGADTALLFLVRHSNFTMSELGTWANKKQAYIDALHKLHPDKTGGATTEDFHRLQDARRILGL